MLAYIDSNIWGLLVVPVGVTLGFGAVVVTWLRRSYGKSSRPTIRHTSDPEE